jgi:hypothetical protein
MCNFTEPLDCVADINIKAVEVGEVNDVCAVLIYERVGRNGT